MNRAWLASLSNVWHSASLPMWLTVLALAFFAIVLVVTLMRAERSAANGALIVITMLAIGIAVTSMLRSSSSGSQSGASDIRPAPQMTASLPALSCLDGIAGESVETACEKALFATADAAAAAVSYTAAQITRLASFGNVASADKVMTPELNALRRTIERDRYGLVAQVLMVREGCTLNACPFFQSLTNTAQIGSHMNERFYDGLIGNYAPLWNAPPPVATASVAPVVTPPPQPNTPTGRPVSGDFPSSASIPPVNIMTPEPSGQGTAQVAPAKPADTSRASVPPTAAKKQAAQKSRAQAPTSLAPAPASDDN